jgi:hypothetical protein
MDLPYLFPMSMGIISDDMTLMQGKTVGMAATLRRPNLMIV